MKIFTLLIFVFASSIIASDKYSIGGRIQGVIGIDSEEDTQDIYLRRLRLNVSYEPWENHKIVYDIRNDKSNKGDKSDGQFEIGDAYWKIDINKNSIKNIKLFRAKVDVSYSQTASSKNLFSPNRTEVSEYASDYVISNRRANNVQVNGALGNWAYQLVLSDGVDSNEIDVLSGSTRSIDSVEGQKLTYGLKLRYYFFGNAKKNQLKETFYGKAKTFSFGVGKFNNDKIILKLSDANLVNVQRSLTNFDLSFAYNHFRFVSEYFIFENDIVNLDASSKNNMLENTSGYYAQAEYLIGKWAPNVGVEAFDQGHSGDTHKLTATTVGLNYYYDNVNMRFGVFYKRTSVIRIDTESNEKSFQLYTMLHF